MDSRPSARRVRRRRIFFRGVAVALADAVEISIKFETKRDFGGKQSETRREYHARFGQDPGPDADIPTNFLYVWEWFWSMSSVRGSSETGAPQPLSASDISGWDSLLDLGMQQPEIRMVMAMDAAYVSTSITEHESVREKQQERQANKPRSKRIG